MTHSPFHTTDHKKNPVDSQNRPPLPQKTSQKAPPKRPKIILASSSPYRRTLLEKLRLPFDCESPNIDETPLPDETVKAMTLRLAQEKARTLEATGHRSAWIIGSDQSACLDGHALGKPHTMARAKWQLEQLSNRTVTFYTSLCLHTPEKTWQGIDETQVTFRSLTAETIQNYLDQERPLQCAGSFQSEGLGITLFHGIHTQDPNALIGLPLIMLTDFLTQAGLTLPQPAA